MDQQPRLWHRLCKTQDSLKIQHQCHGRTMSIRRQQAVANGQPVNTLSTDTRHKHQLSHVVATSPIRTCSFGCPRQATNCKQVFLKPCRLYEQLPEPLRHFLIALTSRSVIQWPVPRLIRCMRGNLVNTLSRGKLLLTVACSQGNLLSP